MVLYTSVAVYAPALALSHGKWPSALASNWFIILGFTNMRQCVSYQSGYGPVKKNRTSLMSLKFVNPIFSLLLSSLTFKVIISNL